LLREIDYINVFVLYKRLFEPYMIMGHLYLKQFLFQKIAISRTLSIIDAGWGAGAGAGWIGS